MNEFSTETVTLNEDIPQNTVAENETPLPNDISNIEEINPPTVEELNQTISALKEELEAYKATIAQKEAIATQLNEFSELFPEISVKSIPDEVWKDVKRGNTLAASYSIYEKRITEAARRIELINKKNAQASAGVAGKNTVQEFFSVDDVRKMSPSEVRANYAKIRRSMEKWN